MKETDEEVAYYLVQTLKDLINKTKAGSMLITIKKLERWEKKLKRLIKMKKEANELFKKGG